MPDVVGKTVEEATQLIEDAGFEVGTVEEVYDEKVEAGKVVSQDPKKGDKREKGSKVNLKVSQGAQEIEVPDLTNMTAEEARQALTVAGLKYKSGEAGYSDSVEKDRIYKQDPVAGSSVSKGAEVTYYLSLGSEGVTVPNVVGLSLNDAIKKINDVGLLVNESYTYEESDERRTPCSARTRQAAN